MSIMLCHLFFSLSAFLSGTFLQYTRNAHLQLQTVFLPLLDVGGKSSWNYYQEKCNSKNIKSNISRKGKLC